MNIYFKLLSRWNLLLLFCNGGIIAGYWALKRLFIQPHETGPFPYAQTTLFLLALIGIQLLVSKLVSKKVSFWAVTYSLLAAPFLFAHWPEQAGFLCLMILPFSVFLLDENKTYPGALLASIFIVILYFYEPHYWLLPAVFLFLGYLVFWLIQKKWIASILVLFLPIFIFIFWQEKFLFSISPYLQIGPVLSIPKHINLQVGLFVYVLFVFAMWGNKLFSIRARSLWFILGIAVFVFILLFTPQELIRLIPFLLACFFLLFYAFWFQQMLFFRARKSVHILSWILIGVNLGVFWYQSQL